jgi:hypothetical protein
VILGILLKNNTNLVYNMGFCVNKTKFESWEKADENSSLDCSLKMSIKLGAIFQFPSEYENSRRQ